MVVDQLHVPDVSSLEAEDDPPVPGYPDSLIPRQIAPQRMQSETRETHVSRPSRFVKTGKNSLDLGRQRGRHTPRIAFLEQALKTLVTKAENHARMCNLSLGSLQQKQRTICLSGTSCPPNRIRLATEFILNERRVFFDQCEKHASSPLRSPLK